jgi:hypothetical protein
MCGIQKFRFAQTVPAHGFAFCGVSSDVAVGVARAEVCGAVVAADSVPCVRGALAAAGVDDPCIPRSCCASRITNVSLPKLIKAAGSLPRPPAAGRRSPEGNRR